MSEIVICHMIQAIMCSRLIAVVTSRNRDYVPVTQIQSARIIVGTSCVGTGLDDGPVGHIIVVGLPFSIEELLQWAGRSRKGGHITVLVPEFHMRGGGDLAGQRYAV